MNSNMNNEEIILNPYIGSIEKNARRLTYYLPKPRAIRTHIDHHLTKTKIQLSRYEKS